MPMTFEKLPAYTQRLEYHPATTDMSYLIRSPTSLLVVAKNYVLSPSLRFPPGLQQGYTKLGRCHLLTPQVRHAIRQG